MKRLFLSLQLATAVLFTVLCDSTVMSTGGVEFVELDGIPITKKDYDAAMKAQKKVLSDTEKRILSDMELEGKMEELESEEVAKGLPQPCHVCRLFVEDFLSYLEENATVSKEEDESPFKFLYDEHFAYDAFDDVCDNFKGYRVTRIAKFRYVKEASLLRQVFDQHQKGSKIKHWMYNTGAEDIDDPTGEIRRLRDECYKLKRKFRLELLDWFENHQNSPLMEWFCRSTYLKKKNQGCLTEKKLLKKPDVNTDTKQPHTEL